MAFGLDFFTVAPGLRLAGDSLAYAYKFTGKGGQLKGLDGLEIGLVDDPTVKLLEGAVSGYEQVADRDTVYDALVAGGLTEIVPGLAIGIDSLSSIEAGEKSVRLACAGQQPTLVFNLANVQENTKLGDGGYTWELPPGTFTVLKAAAESYQSDLKTKVEEMIAARISADGVLQAAVDAQAVSDATARAVIQADVDQNEADADAAIAAEASTRETNDNTIIASVASEASTREAADTALSGRLDVLEADPTTATAVAAGDTATLSSANSYTDTSITNLVNGADAALDTLKEIGDALAQGDSDVTAALTAQITTEATARANADSGLSGRLDTLEADPTTQTLLDAETTARTTADTALDGRVATLEGNAAITDPTTATAVAAVQSDVDQNEADSDAADAALSGRLDVLEADPTTATAVAAVQADVDANEADADAADAALSGRLDVLEADPTTATAVAAVQADVDQNEADADAALALKAPLADPDFTGQLEVDTNARLEFDSNLTKLSNVLRGTSIVIGNNITLNPAAADGRVEIEGEFYLRPSDLTDAADDTAAAAAGIIVGQVYRNGSQLMVRVS